jgi:UDP-N-acetylmuramoylalanine--D-glutamate ligase
VPELDTEATIHKLPNVDQHLYEISLLGEHNQYNANVVYTVCSELYGMSDEEIRSAFADFKGLPHRMEFIGNVNGINYYDDSISTIPEATIQAAQSIENAKSIIIGGMDRNIDYSLLIDFIRSHTDILYIFAYPSGERIYKEVGNLPC